MPFFFLKRKERSTFIVIIGFLFEWIQREVGFDRNDVWETLKKDACLSYFTQVEAAAAEEADARVHGRRQPSSSPKYPLLIPFINQSATACTHVYAFRCHRKSRKKSPVLAPALLFLIEGTFLLTWFLFVLSFNYCYFYNCFFLELYQSLNSAKKKRRRQLSRADNLPHWFI